VNLGSGTVIPVLKKSVGIAKPNQVLVNINFPYECNDRVSLVHRFSNGVFSCYFTITSSSGVSSKKYVDI
jgi:hypothetical protein